jgi:hypothetical protein
MKCKICSRKIVRSKFATYHILCSRCREEKDKQMRIMNNIQPREVKYERGKNAVLKRSA